ncbi:recombinase family protein [Paenibacillus daejeonensis]|uniref:recombinase family protein n=1 Tax=Paenibacillus daejeonensis TaxID=135193 RepID=UPI000377E36E|nr:recombinase family protein [Paenibacillus daejeonensis]
MATGLYGRISDDEQSKYSVSDQMKENRTKAGIEEEIIEYIDEGVSGALMSRPAMDRLRKDIKDGIITKVICWDPDRLSRDLMIQLLLANEIEKRAELVFVNHDYKKTPEGILFFQMRGAFSQFEKAKITERTSRGRREKASQGKVVKNSKMYGYDYDAVNSTYVINEAEAAIVRFIFEAFVKPNNLVKGINGIAVYLTEHGVPTKRGAAVWHRQVVRQLLLNRSYTGQYAQNRWNTEGMVGNKYRDADEKVRMKLRPEEEWAYTEIPMIIDEQTFETAQLYIAESKRRFAPESLRKYLLSGLVRCGDCNNTMTGRRDKSWGVYVLEYTDLKNYSGAKHKGCGMRMRCETLDKLVWDTVVGWLNHPDEIAAAAEEHQEQSSFEVNEIDRLQNEVEKCREKRKKLIKLFTTFDDDEESQEAIRVEMRALTDREKTMAAKVEQLRTTMQQENSKERSQHLMQEAAAFYFSRADEEWTFEDRQALIRIVVREVRVFKDRTDIYTF